MKKQISGSIIVLMLSAASAVSSPMSDFNAVFADAYAAYRVALFTTNTGDADKSRKALSLFNEKWSAITKDYSTNPPPQYQDDAKWPHTLTVIESQLKEATDSVANGKLPSAHEALEGIRDEFGNLHARNEIEQFSDRMNAYHTEMEHVLAMDISTIDETVSKSLLEHAAVLSWLAADILQAPPTGTATTDAEYKALSSAFSASVETLLTSAREGNPEALKKAVGGLKVPYSKFFLKYG